MKIHPLKIGNVEVENNIWLAPMAGITDLPFRILCKEQGAGLVCTEMASSKAIYYQDEKTKKILNILGETRPIQAQIFGSDIEAMKVAAKEVSKIADILDINMGCPAPKVVKNGDGSKLLLNLELVEEIVTEVVKHANIPVTVKIRKGWDNNHIVAVQAAKIIERAGASAITIHGRTREEYFSGEIDYEVIKEVKQSVNIPVIGNGNIVDEESAQRMFEKTNVDGIMIGRAAIGNPWIFSKLVTYFRTGEKQEEIPLEKKAEIMIHHIIMEIEEKGERVGIAELRKHMAYYTKNLRQASRVRQKINEIITKKELIEYIKECFK